MVQTRTDVTTVLIAGPTASGKSALALRYAERIGALVVNADSMQVYRHLPILTAQPSAEERSHVPHALYGYLDPSLDYSTGAWMRDVARVLREARDDRRPVVLVGGTGLYFRALLGGIDAMPEVPSEIREAVRARMASEGPERLHGELARRDPEAAARIRSSDPQRIARALELLDASGGPLSALQKGRGEALVAERDALKIVLTPARAILRDRIARRFETMMAKGALEEARRFAPGGLVAGATAAKAIGLAELLQHLAGRCPLDRAVERAIIRSRQYAKRQDTWFRHQLDAAWHRQGDGDRLLVD